MNALLSFWVGGVIAMLPVALGSRQGRVILAMTLGWPVVVLWTLLALMEFRMREGGPR